jgi:hypothetical protein
MAAIGIGVFGAFRDLAVALLPVEHAAGPQYDIGASILFFYAGGVVLGITALQRTVAAAILMLPLGACPYLLGGSYAQAFGIAIAAIGVLLLINEAVAAIRRRRAGNAKP